MYVNAWLSPCLGTSTVLENSCDAVRTTNIRLNNVLLTPEIQQVRFVAVLEVAEYARNNWIVELWYGRKDCEWESAAFAQASATDLTVHDASKHMGLEKLIYTLNLPNFGNSSPLKFTLRFKSDINGPWIWIRDQTHAEDGQIIFRQPTVAASITFDHLFSEPDTNFSAKSIASQTPGVDVFDVSAPAPALNDEWSSTSMGTPTALEHFYALVNIVTLTHCSRKTDDLTGKAPLTRILCRQGVAISLWDHGSHRPPQRWNLYGGIMVRWVGILHMNSLGRELTQDRILDSLQDLHDNGIFVTTVIIDDNWQSLDNKMRWDKFEANEYFPNGLKGLTAEIRRRFKHIKHIAVWHAVIGYWEGIAPEFLRDSGIDSVKCIQNKRAEAFFGRVIYCMAMVPQIFFHSLLHKNGPAVLVRNSDDFYPDIPDSHLWHLFCNAMNNIFTNHLNCLPDWDMFQTSLPVYGGVHAAGRCISGGPIYITDSPGSHSVPILNQMSAASVREPDRLIVLRPSRISLPLDPYVAYNGNRLLKLATIFGSTSMLAVFNVSSCENSELISLLEFRGLKEKTLYVVRQQSTGKIFGPATTATDNTLVSLTLAVAGWEFLSAFPVQSRGSFEVGVLGLVSQLAGAAGVVDSLVADDGKVTAVSVTVKALGVLGFYISDLKTRKIDDLFVTIANTPVPVHTVTKSQMDSTVLEVDIETAWREKGLRTRWSNEVVVKLFLE
ncbi:glycoside hydrolase superfamily [Trichophaea hybrida]|nr:glycoside hydrolase superfamily [Trichophaea hybrida]